MTDVQSFAYVAVGADGRRVRGQVSGASEQAAFERLRRQGLSPLKLRPTRAGKTVGGDRALRDRESAEILLSLADLLSAGADMRSALNVLLSRAEGSRVAGACRRLLQEISAGEALDAAFARTLAPRHGFVAALIAAGEAAGDLPQALRRAGEMLEAAIKLREQLVGALAYPLFVLISTLAAAGVILLAVVPSLEPLVSEGGGEGTPILSALLAVSRLLRDHGLVLVGGLAAVAALILIMGRAGLLAGPFGRLLLGGPWRRTTGALFYGGFAVSLGAMLSAGAPMSDALRLASRGVRSELAKARLQPVLVQVRQGAPLSEALQAVKGFPPTVVRLVSVGESTGALGRMLQRSGKLEEDAAVRDIEAAARLLGPALIVLLGGLIGLMMAGLLSGVTELGQAALN
jgi:type II secretory pathway component PulF